MDLTSTQSHTSTAVSPADDSSGDVAESPFQIALPKVKPVRHAPTNEQTRNLLDRFAKTGYPECFEEIVSRYGAMVLSVCQNVLHNRHDAEDATQTTFFVLAEQVRAGRVIHSLGSWLQQVARRASVDLRRSRSRRSHREQERSVPELMDDSAPGGCERTETAELVREELDKIPAKYRIPIVLHYFGGLEFAEVAEQLNIKQPTLGVRLFRGRKMLAERLARRGLALSTPVLAMWLGRVVRQSITQSLQSATVRAALSPAATRVSAMAASRLSGSVLGTFVVSSKLKLVLVVGLVAAAAAVAGAAVGHLQRLSPILDMEKFRLPLPSYKSRIIPRIADNLPRKHADDSDNGIVDPNSNIFPNPAELPRSPVNKQQTADDTFVAGAAGGTPLNSTPVVHKADARNSQIAALTAARDAQALPASRRANQYAWASPTWPGRFAPHPAVPTPAASHPPLFASTPTATQILAMGGDQYGTPGGLSANGFQLPPVGNPAPLGGNLTSMSGPYSNTVAVNTNNSNSTTLASAAAPGGVTRAYPAVPATFGATAVGLVDWSQALTISSQPSALSTSAPQWAYLEPTNPFIPALPTGQTFLGTWAINPGEDLSVSFNNAALAQYGQTPAGLTIWAFNGQWTPLTGSVNGQVATPAGTEFVALGIPEPGSVAVVGLIGSMLALRRGRRGRPFPTSSAK